jgi:DNA polymerase V
MRSTKSRRRLWALVDCNNFFASCERLFRPDLTGKPVVVLSNNDGCIVARSNEAKALGIGMGEPEFKARTLLKRHKVEVFSSNYALYSDISSRVMRTLETLVPDVEQYSVDEAFLLLKDSLAVNADELARAVRKRVRKWVGITVSVGVGPTRTLAKLASEIAKKGEGVCRLDAQSPETEHILAHTPVGEIWGIGRQLREKLRIRAIYTAKDLRDADPKMLQKLLTVAGLNTQMELRGFSCIEEKEVPPSRRTIISSRSFGEKVAEMEYLAQALAANVTSAAEKLRRAGLEAKGIEVHIRTSRFADGPVYDRSAQVTLPRPTCDTLEFIRASRRGLETIYRPGHAYAKSGVMLYDLARAGSGRTSLFDLPEDAEARQRSARLMKAFDGVNRKFGSGTVRFAAVGEEDAPWRVKHEHRSRQWTTKWDELPVAKS